MSGMFSLDGKVALVTGANSGIGLIMARGLRDAGACVAVTGRNPEKNASAEREFGAGSVIAMDVRDERSVERATSAVVERFGRLNILVNNAGAVSVAHVQDMPLEQWRETIDTNLTGTFLCSKHAARVMIERGDGGKIINVASIYAIFGPPDFSHYAASKSGIVGFTRALAVELAPHRITANAILPGYYDTDMSSGLPQWLRRDIERKTPGGRFGTGEELVGPLVFLASSASDWITGQAIPVDGGYSVADRFIHDLPE